MTLKTGRKVEQFKEPSDFEHRAKMLRDGLDYSVERGFMTQAQADEWFARWCIENSEHLGEPE